MHRAILALTLPLAAGCVSVHDETPPTLERRSDHLYRLTAQVETFGVTPTAVTAAIGSTTYPMIDVGGGRWEATASLGTCAKAFQVRYEVQYPQPIGTGSATLVEPPSATATVGGLLKQVTPDPKLGSCAARSIFRVNDPRFLRDFDTTDGACNANAPGSGAVVCTLQAAIEQSNADAGPATIEVPAGSYAAPDYFTPRSDIVIAGIEPGVVISTHISIFVSGATATPPTVELRDLTLRGGVRSDSGSLRLVRVNVLDGHPFLVDAGVLALGALDIDQSTITGNGTVGVRLTGARGRITNSLIANNALDGGIECAPRSGVSSNLEIFNSTITGNRRRFGGVAVRNRCRATFRNVTIAGNETTNAPPGARSSGGLTVDTGGTVILANTILADNVNTPDPANADCAAGASTGSITVQSLGNNLLESSASCSFSSTLGRADVPVLSAGLAALADNGGPTRTMLPLTGSPALGAGSPDPYNDAFTAACTRADQRGITRTGACDIGAVQAPR
jgi:hypothetical protein